MVRTTRRTFVSVSAASLTLAVSGCVGDRSREADEPVGVPDGTTADGDDDTDASDGSNGDESRDDDAAENGDRLPEVETLSIASATQYQGPACDCCDVYSSYLEDHLEGDLDVTVTDEMVDVKSEYDVPSAVRSCHTLVLDGYVVEGHVPVEVIAELFEREPAVDGIALPGMPAGSPGMGGQKQDTWTVYEIDGDDYDVFVEL